MRVRALLLPSAFVAAFAAPARAGKADVYALVGARVVPVSGLAHVFIDGVAQSLETRYTRLYQQFKDRP